MKTYVHLCYIAEFFLTREVLQTKAVEKNKKTHFLFSKVCPQIVPFITECAKIW